MSEIGRRVEALHQSLDAESIESDSAMYRSSVDYEASGELWSKLSLMLALLVLVLAVFLSPIDWKFVWDAFAQVLGYFETHVK